MPTALERAVDALSDPTVSTPDALRGLLVVVRRIGATDLAKWVRHELGGYEPGDELPSYRRKELPIALHFDGPWGISDTMRLSAAELPDHLAASGKQSYLRGPVAELEALAGGEGDPELGLPTAWVAAYRIAVDEGRAPSPELMVLNRAGILAPRTHLRGLLDQIKTAALELALELEDLSPEVGEAGGPTVSGSQELAAKVAGLHVQIMGDGNVVVLGDNNATATGEEAQAVALQVGDVEGLLTAARAYVDEAAVEALSEAIREDGDIRGEKTRTWLETVKRGGYGLVGGMATNGAYDGLQALFQAVPPVDGRG